MPKCGGVSMEIKDSNENLVCFKNLCIIKKSLNSNMSSPFIMETNVLDNPKTCAKSIGMGNSPNYF